MNSHLEIVTLPTGEECFQLGRGDCSPTPTDRKKNSEDKLYFHPIRLPCQSEKGDVQLSVESRLSSPQQQRAASPFNSRNAGQLPITRIRRTPISPPSSRMRAFNREFGYKTCKHPISCHQSDIRRWIISDGIKECRPHRSLQYSTGSVCDGSLQTKEHLSSTANLTGARESTRSDPTVQTILDTSLSDTQENATFHDVIIESDDNEQQAVRHSLLAAGDQRELPNDLQTGTASQICCTGSELANNACPPLFGHDDRYHYHQTALPSTRSFLSERRYSDDGHDVGIRQHIVVTLPDFHHSSLTLTGNAVSLKYVFQRIITVLASDRKKSKNVSKPIITLSRLDRKNIPSVKQKTFICLQASSDRDR